MTPPRRIRRPNGAALEELRWYYCDVGGALGMRASSMEPSTSKSEWGISAEVDDGRPAAEHYVFLAVARERAIARALARLDEGDERTLRAAHTPVEGAHRFLVPEFAELANAVVGFQDRECRHAPLTLARLRVLVTTTVRGRMPGETQTTLVDARHAARDALAGHARRVEERVREVVGDYQRAKRVVDREGDAERRRMLYVAMTPGRCG